MDRDVEVNDVQTPTVLALFALWFQVAIEWKHDVLAIGMKAARGEATAVEVKQRLHRVGRNPEHLGEQVLGDLLGARSIQKKCPSPRSVGIRSRSLPDRPSTISLMGQWSIALPGPQSGGPLTMFVSKAAVVGGGTMGGEIAQAIAAADIPVVVKDIDQKFVDAALEKARSVTEGQLGRLVKKEKLTQEQADARLTEVMDLIIGTTGYGEFADVDFVVEAVPEKMEIKQAVFRELDAATPGHGDPCLQHLLTLDHRDG